VDADQALIMEIMDAALLSGFSFYCPAVADVAVTAASLTAATITVVVTLSGSFSYCPAVAAVMDLDSDADVDANYSQQFFSSCLRSRL
jgi:hypothetical protein